MGTIGTIGTMGHSEKGFRHLAIFLRLNFEIANFPICSSRRDNGQDSFPWISGGLPKRWVGELLDFLHEDWKSRVGCPSGRRPIEYIGEDITTGQRGRAPVARVPVVEALGQL